jgi:hypothetical protein
MSVVDSYAPAHKIFRDLTVAAPLKPAYWGELLPVVDPYIFRDLTVAALLSVDVGTLPRPHRRGPTHIGVGN